MEKDRPSMEVLDFLRKIASKGGKRGGKRSLETMTDKERRERARKAGLASGKARKAKAKKS